jgi:hypothetical protein
VSSFGESQIKFPHPEKDRFFILKGADRRDLGLDHGATAVQGTVSDTDAIVALETAVTIQTSLQILRQPQRLHMHSFFINR